MTQEPQNPDAPQPPETPRSAWAPRPDPNEPAASSSPAETTPESTSETVTPVAETPPPASEPAAVATATATAEPATPAPVAPRRSGVPPWLLIVAAIVPAVIVGLAVYFLAGSSDDDDPSAAAGIVDGLMRLGQANQSNITSYAGELPPDFDPSFPMYGNADVVVSIALASEQGTGYLIVMSTPDPAADVFTFYSDALDADPWQVEIGRSSDEFTGLRFLRPDNIDVTGDVSLHRSDLGQQTVIYLSYSDASQAILPGGDTPFTLGPTRPLPVGFPEDIPIYQGAEESVILDTYFERGQGGQAFIVTFLTRDSQDDVIEFYRDEFEARGWVVSDSGVSSSSFALAIEFDDGPAQSVSGSITADTFDNDDSFTQVDLLVTKSNN